MANQNLELALKIKALVEGAKNVQGLAGDVQKLQGQAKTPMGDPTKPLQDGLKKTGGMVDDLVQSMAGLLTLGAIGGFVRNSIAEFNKAEAGFRGLEAVANRSGVGIGRAMQEAEKLAADGLISVQDAQKALQNLLSRGYDISQATGTIAALKDSAVTGRAAHLSLAEAVVTATEGLRNENSILVDNAGVTKNVSVLWKEYAASVGKSVTELTQAEKVQAEYNGILRETEAFTGQAANAANTLQGQMAKLTVENQKAKAEMGQALMPAMLELTRAGVFLIQNFMKPAIFFGQSLGIALGHMGANFSAFIRLLKNRDLAQFTKDIQANAALADEMRTSAAGNLNAGLQFTPNPSAGGTGSTAPTTPTGDPAKAASAAKKAADEARRVALAGLGLKTELAEQAARLEQDDIERQIAGNKAAFDAKLIDAADYYATLTEFQRQQADSEIRLLETQRAAAQSVGGSAADKIKAQAEVARINTDIELVERRVAQQQIDNALARQAAASALKLQQTEYIDGLEQEAFLADLNNDARETALLLLEAEKLGITDINHLLELQGQIRQANADKDATKETQRQQDELYSSVQQGVQKAFADGINSIGTEGGGMEALRGLVDTIKNAMGNAISGSFTDGFLGLLGGKEGVLGIAGSMGLGGKKDGSTPGSAIYVSDVAAGGALGAVTGEGGGMFAGFFESIKGFFSDIASGISGLFSGLANSLAGLFSGGGGGGSNAGSWVSAIARAFGYAEGGYTGAGGKYQPAGVVHAGEFVFSAESVRRLGLGALNNLHRLAKGGMAPTMPRLSYADGGLVNLPGSAAPSVTSNTKIVNMFDFDSAFAEYLNTRGGERSILNVVQRNPNAVGA